MIRIEAMFLINRMRHRELLQFAEKERMIKKIRKEPTQTKNFPRTLSLWIRVSLLEKTSLSQRLFVKHGTTNPCCNMKPTQLR